MVAITKAIALTLCCALVHALPSKPHPAILTETSMLQLSDATGEMLTAAGITSADELLGLAGSFLDPLRIQLKKKGFKFEVSKIQCAVDEKVVNHLCEPCESGHTTDAVQSFASGDDTTCNDIDECDDDAKNHCAQNCHNTK